MEHLPPVPRSARPHCTDCDGAFVVKRLVGCPPSALCGGVRGCGYTGQSDRGPQCGAHPGVCPPLTPRPLAEGASSVGAEFVRELGPDELLVTLEGGQVATLYGVHVGGCVYVFPYSLVVPGLYRLTVLGVRADWDAVDETKTGFPNVTLDNISGRELFVTVGNASLSEVARTAVLDARSGSPSRNGSLPQCPGGVAALEQAVHGAWIRSSPTTRMFDAAPVRPPRTPFVVADVPGDTFVDYPWSPGLSYFTNYATGLTWAPHTCAGGRSQQPLGSCLAKLGRLFISGDSQMRTLFNHFMHRLCEIEDAVDKSHSPESCHHDNAVCPGFTGCSAHDAYGETASSVAGRNVTTLVNFGQHFASIKRVPLAGYEAALVKYVSTLSNSTRSLPPVLWVDTLPFPIRNDLLVHKFGDWRTTHRLRLFNEAANFVLKPWLSVDPRVLAGVVRLHDLVLPLVDWSFDRNHLENVLPGMDASLDVVVSVLCG